MSRQKRPIQAVPSACSSRSPAGQPGPAAVEDADVVQAEEPALEGVAAVGVLAVDPPGEVQQQLVEDLLQEVGVGAALDLAGDLVDAAGGAGVDRRVDVGEVPLVGRELAVGVHVPLAQEQHELPLGPLGVEPCQRDAVEGDVPGGEPGVLPLVRARSGRRGCRVPPARVPPRVPRGRRRRAGRVAVQPELDAVVVELLRPEQARRRLPLHEPLVVGQAGRLDGGVERVGLGDPSGRRPRRSRRRGRRADRSVNRVRTTTRLARPERRAVVRRGLRAPPLRGSPGRARPPTTQSWKASLT